ncbi:hypothetical protein EGW69_01310 [Enterococcus faecium]|uniref:Uncharacterized protein n=1 Tax=Enterococcus faecium TaxID=1352 RepID=A0A2G0E9A2_ENTFC|nr:hypothetical protein CEQ01_10395 [Enterococcus faecium]EGP5103669.1 hypothetical protein [Enterococcus faecium]EGP5129091.1 hypothetical protein [Enterococcus faecium]EGP5134639.1 hypothetical protein [Enterococcus faecium]EGP5142738.1 hypothetical protein [Enterococcus faecium]
MYKVQFLGIKSNLCKNMESHFHKIFSSYSKLNEFFTTFRQSLGLLKLYLPFDRTISNLTKNQYNKEVSKKYP